jgi:[ribosomal protein S18]-alanine N-acetyltransferase
MISIYEGDGRDVALIMPIMESAFDPRYGEAWSSSQCMGLLAMPGSQMLIAAEEDRAIGFVLSRWVVDEEELLMIGVSPQQHRVGVGSLLIKQLITAAHSAGRSKIFLEVRDGNAAQSFYATHGFTQCGRRKAYYSGNDGQRYDAITMAASI